MHPRNDHLSDFSRDPNPPSFISAPSFQKFDPTLGSSTSESNEHPLPDEDVFGTPSSSSPPSPHSITELDPFNSVHTFSSYAFPLAVHVQLPPSAREQWASGCGRAYASFPRRPGASTSSARPATTSASVQAPTSSSSVMAPRARRHPSEPRLQYSRELPQASPSGDARPHQSAPLTYPTLSRSPSAMMPSATSESERPRISDLTHVSRPTMKLLVDGDNMTSELNFIRQRREEREKDVARAVKEIRAEKKAKRKATSKDLSHDISKENALQDESNAESSSPTRDSTAPAHHTTP